MVDLSQIRGSMNVVTSDGQHLGYVCRLEGSHAIRVTQLKDGRGFEHVIPLAWVSAVDRYVFLSKSSAYCAANWDAGEVHRRPWAA